MDQKKKYVIESYPIMKREAVIYAKDQEEAWDIYWGDAEGDIKFDSYGELKFTEFEDYIDPDIYEDKQQKEVA
tara:strand:+ start:944 stop:1162 length:219 start_codon:yes stop_codon:yes gene_type:complete